MTESSLSTPNYGHPLDAAAKHWGVPEDLVTFLRKVETANRHMRTGDAQPYIELWQRSPNVTLSGAWGPIEQGIDRLRSTFDWVGTRFTGGEVDTTYTAIRTSGDLAVTVGFETGPTSINHDEASLMRIRVTHVFERAQNGTWVIVHRHADFPPPDERLEGSS